MSSFADSSKKILRGICLVSIGLLLATLVTEVFLRVMGISALSFWQPDWERGVVLRPNQEGWYRDEGGAYIRINVFGYRDREHEVEKAKNIYRIAILGDSFAAALEVPFEKTFWHQLEEQLNSGAFFSQKRVEVLNFGVTGYGQAQEYLTLEKDVWRYSPDLVVLAFFAGNDLIDNSKDLHLDPGPCFVETKDGLVLDYSFRENLDFKRNYRWSRWGSKRILNHFRVLQVIKQFQHVFQLRRTEKVKLTAFSGIADRPRLEAGIRDLAWFPLVYSHDPSIERAWRVTGQALELISRAVKEKGVQFLVVSATLGIQVNPDRETRDRIIHRQEIPDLFYPDHRLEALGRRYHFPVLLLAPPFQKYADKTQIFLHGFDKGSGWTRNLGKGTGHWNAEGHALAATIISDYIREHMASQH